VGAGWSSSRAPVSCHACGQEWARDPALEVACAQCHAKVGTWCKNPSGHKSMSLHRARMQRALDEGVEKPCPGARPSSAPPGAPVDPWLARAAIGRGAVV
jgi:hypothetical protein